MALSPRIFAGVALIAGVAAAGLIAKNQGSTPAPAPVAKRASTPAPTPTPIDPAKLPEAYRGDTETLPSNVLTNLMFIEEMLTGPHRQTMEQVTCHCCKKSLAQCYLDTATKAPKACSPLCGVCSHEGHDVAAAAKVGMPLEELRAGLARAYSHEEPM